VVLHVGAWDATALPVEGQLATPQDAAWQRMYLPLLGEAEEILTAAGAHLYLMGSPDLHDRERTDEVLAYNRLLRDYAAERSNVSFIDTFGALEAEVAGEADRGRLRKNDGVHLCPAGAARVAQTVVAAVGSGSTSGVADDWFWGDWRLDPRYAHAGAGCDAWSLSPNVR
jgi:hypothetical protein